MPFASVHLLAGNDIGDDGTAFLADALKGNTTLKEINLDRMPHYWESASACPVGWLVLFPGTTTNPGIDRIALVASDLARNLIQSMVWVPNLQCSKPQNHVCFDKS